jgi:D-alanyl-D-alanine carboxypeptidase
MSESPVYPMIVHRDPSWWTAPVVRACSGEVDAGSAAIGRILGGVTMIGLAAGALLLFGADTADARLRPHAHAVGHRVVHGSNYHPPYAALVVDDNSGQVLHEVSPDEPRHPASLTKIMTLYLLFEQLESGNLKLDTALPISVHAASQPPTKLGLRPGQTILVEDAIKGLVTKSANDAAAVVAEAIAGSEEDFAQRMTLKARALGMSGTTYVNASGLPADEQNTTARDQITLGRAIQMRFPKYYAYFSTPFFIYRGMAMNNHNSLLRTVDGVDGIKTGYTEASGYNLVASVRRDNRHIVCVVLGGTSNAARDARMRQLIEDNIPRAATARTAPMIVEKEPEPQGSEFSLSSTRSIKLTPEPAKLTPEPAVVSQPVPADAAKPVDAVKPAVVVPDRAAATPKPADEKPAVAAPDRSADAAKPSVVAPDRAVATAPPEPPSTFSAVGAP